MDVTYADTWILEYTNKYTNSVSKMEEVFDKTYTGDDIDELKDTENEIIREETLAAGVYPQEELQKEIDRVPDAKQWLNDKYREGASTGKASKSDVLIHLTELASNKGNTIKKAINDNSNEIVNLIMSDDYSEKRQDFILKITPAVIRPEVLQIIENTHKWYIESERTNQYLRIRSVNVVEYENKKNQTEHSNIQSGGNTYIQGTPTIKEKTSDKAYAFSTVGLEWIKTWEHYGLRQFMRGEVSWDSNQMIMDSVTEDGLMYKSGTSVGINHALAFAFGFDYCYDYNSRKGFEDAIEQVRLLYKNLHNLDDYNDVPDEKAVDEIMQDYGFVGAEIPVEVVDEAIVEAYEMQRKHILYHIELAQKKYGGAGVEEFTTAQIDALQMDYYAGWATRQDDVAEIYRCIVQGDTDTLDKLIVFTGKKDIQLGLYREDALRALFFEGEYRTAGYYVLDDKTDILDPQDYTSGDLQRNYGFISLINKYPQAKRNFISGAGMYFDAFETGPDASEQVDIMKWLLYLLTDDYNYSGYETDWLVNMTRNDNYTIHYGTDINVNTLKCKKEMVLDEDQLREAITLAYENSPERQANLLEHVDDFIDMQNRYHVNALFAIAVSIMETGAGTSWSAIDSSTNNWFSITADPSSENAYHDPNSSNPLYWRTYPDVRAAIMDFGNLIANGDFYFKKARYTVTQISEPYCKETCEEWANAINNELKRVYRKMGINFGDEFTFGIEVYNSDGTANIAALNDLKVALEQYVGLKHCDTDASYSSSGVSVNETSDRARVRAAGVKYWNYPYSLLEIYQCTWWANGRASMYLDSQGIAKAYPTQHGNGGDYWEENLNGKWFNCGKTPKQNSLLVKGGIGTTGILSCGHVMYVEAVDQINKKIYVSHAGGGTHWNGISCITFNELETNKRYKGFIYLDEPLKDLSYVTR